MDDWVLNLILGGLIGLTLYKHGIGLFVWLEWRRLRVQFDEHLKQRAAAYDVPPIPMITEPLSLKSSHGSMGAVRGEFNLGAGQRRACSVDVSAEHCFEVSVTYTAPRLGRFQEMNFNLTDEAMKLSLEGEVYPLSLAQAKLAFETLGLEPWPQTLKRFTYDSAHVELTLLSSTKELKSHEALTRLDELWVQCGEYFERFLTQDIEHSKASQLKDALLLER